MILNFKTFLKDKGLAYTTIEKYAGSISSYLPLQLEKYNIDIDKNISSYSITEIESLFKRVDKGGDLEYIGDYGNNTIRNAVKMFILYIKKEAQNFETYENSISESSEFSIENFSKEIELHDFIVKNIKTIFPNYHLSGREFPIDNKRLDLILEANDNSHLLIIELKANIIDKKAFGQISEYLVLAEKKFNKEVRGMLIGGFFEKHIPELLKTSKYKIEAKKYKIKFELE